MNASSALTKVREQLEKAKERMTAMRARGEEALGQGLAAVEVFTGAAAGGFVDERFGEDQGDGIKVHKTQGVPTNLLIGAGGKVAAFMGVFGKHAGHGHEIANGFLAAYGTNVGRAVAKKTHEHAPGK